MIAFQEDQAPGMPVMPSAVRRPRTQNPGATTVAGAPVRPMAGGFRPITRRAPQVTPPAPTQPGDVSAGLRSDVYTPGGDTRLQGAQGVTDAATQNAVGGPGYSSMAQGAQQRYRSVFGGGQVQGRAALGADAPNRTALARQALADFDIAGEEGLNKRFRSIGQNAARLGRVGMGDTGRDVAEAGRLYESDRMRFANELARSVSEGDIDDRFRERDTLLGLDERNVDRDFDRSRASIDAGNLEAGNELSDRYRRVDTARGVESDVFGQGRANRDEFRAERGRQDDLAQRGIDNRVRERSLGNEELDQRLRRAIAMNTFGGRGAPSLEEILAQYGGV